MIVYEYVCVKCGAHYLSGEEHKCAQKSSPAKKPTTKPVAKTEASSKNSPSSRRIATPPEPVATSGVATPLVATKPVATETERVATWRAKNRERYNARMRVYRARQKALE